MRLTEIQREKLYDIIEGPGLLFTGANGHKTYGIKVRSLGSKADVEDRGYRREWEINDHTLAKVSTNELALFLGIADEEAQQLQSAVANLSAAQE